MHILMVIVKYNLAVVTESGLDKDLKDAFGQENLKWFLSLLTLTIRSQSLASRFSISFCMSELFLLQSFSCMFTELDSF